MTAAAFDQDQTFMLVEIDVDELHFETISRTGTTVDAGSIIRSIRDRRRKLRRGCHEEAEALAERRPLPRSHARTGRGRGFWRLWQFRDRVPASNSRSAPLIALIWANTDAEGYYLVSAHATAFFVNDVPDGGLSLA